MKFTFEIHDEDIEPVDVRAMLMRGFLALRSELEAVRQKRRQIDDRSPLAVRQDRELGAEEDKLTAEHERWKDLLASFEREG